MNRTASAPGAGVEFLRFHRDFKTRALNWYRSQPGANLTAVADTWRAVPAELKQASLGWNSSLASAEQRLMTNSPAFASEDELGRFIEVNLHNWIHGAAGNYYGDQVLLYAERAPTSTYFYKIHGLVDYWWTLYRGLNDVGVIASSQGCQSAFTTATLFMDNEDNNSQSKVSGWVGATTVDGNRNTNFTFCRVNGTQFRSLTSGSNARANYAVLKLGATCPPGSVEFARHFDNEDNDNKNRSNYQIYPNVVDRNSTLYWCLFKGDGATAQSLPRLGFDYGVFAGSQFGFTSARGSIYTDDEDNNNANWYGADSAWKSIATSIVTEGSNTTMYTAQAGFPSCGDLVCNGVETSSSCFGDCPVCGDGMCTGRETASSCRADCGWCGDGYCAGNEDSSSCSADCSSSCWPALTGADRGTNRLPAPCMSGDEPSASQQ